MNFFGVDEGSLFTFGNMGDTLGDLRMGVSIICEILSQLIFVMLTWKKNKGLSPDHFFSSTYFISISISLIIFCKTECSVCDTQQVTYPLYVLANGMADGK